jgi:hypothetical protein
LLVILGLSDEIAANRKCRNVPARQENEMSLGMILLIVVVLMLIGAIPAWPHSRSWGYAPSGGLGLVLVIILVLFLLGRI